MEVPDEEWALFQKWKNDRALSVIGPLSHLFGIINKEIIPLVGKTRGTSYSVPIVLREAMDDIPDTFPIDIGTFVFKLVPVGTLVHVMQDVVIQQHKIVFKKWG